MNANSSGGRKKSSKQFPWIQNMTLSIFALHLVLPNFFFLMNDSKQFTNQLTGDHLTFANDDSHDDDASILPLSEGRSMSKGKSINSNVIPQELPKPDDLAIVHFDYPQGKLLSWHYRLNQHRSGVLQTFSKMCMLLRRLTQLQVPKCSAHIFGAMHKQPWHSNANMWNIRTMANIIAPGQCVLVDQLVSPESSFIAQLKG